MGETVQELLAKLRVSDEPQLSAFLPDPEGQNVILRNLPCALLVLDTNEGIVLELNDYALQLFGVDRFAVIGKTLRSAGITVEMNSDSAMTSPGNPSRGSVKDSNGVPIPVLVFQHKVRLTGRNADVILIIDSTLIGGSRTAEASLDLFKRVLVASGTNFIFASITGGALERDLQVIETGGEIPEAIREKTIPGASISDIFSPVNAARVVEDALILSEDGGEKALKLKECTPFVMYADKGNRVLMVYPAVTEKKKVIRTKTSSLSSSMKMTVLYIASSASARKSGKEMLEMIGFHVTEVESPASGQIIFDENPGRFHFVVCEEFTDDPDLLGLAGEMENAGTGLVLVTNEDFDYLDDMKIAKLSPPLSINLLASAVSKVSS
ncbi:MAG: hypothetical protein KAH54_08490 [Candidatus Sabulitectum sp.]|nr:hypothetical protein [Candidatus Sabulitectum sp.]